MQELTKEEATALKRHKIFYFQNVIRIEGDIVFVEVFNGARRRFTVSKIPYSDIKWVESFSPKFKRKMARYYAPSKLFYAF